MHVELRLLGMAGQWFRGQLDCVRVAPAGDAPLVRVALTDVTQRSLSETHRRIACNAIDAREAERRCVARELHEDLGQRLGALKMELASLDAAIEAVARRCRIRAMLETLDGAIGTIRRIATDLHPLLLDDLGLNAAIDWFARDMAQRLGLKVRVHLDEDDLPTDERVSVAIYRMAQEALAHVALHTRSSCVDIHLEQRGGTVVLQVEGNGPERHAANAFAADSETTLALRDRAHMLGGELAFGGSGRAGARIAMRLSPARGPLAPNGPAASP
jgi:two-component system sensor histidine kinase UhpB